MDPETYSELSQAWIEVRDDPEVWCSIVTGAGDKSFSAGGNKIESMFSYPVYLVIQPPFLLFSGKILR
ncbi:MAG: hypothetical protein QF682_11600 [Candidatus Thermoplasmatota archaeon]|nr:hypothetical protein [Candidatus Thermoplasmatota archaeon]